MAIAIVAATAGLNTIMKTMGLNPNLAHIRDASEGVMGVGVEVEGVVFLSVGPREAGVSDSEFGFCSTRATGV